MPINKNEITKEMVMKAMQCCVMAKLVTVMARNS